MPGRAVVVVVVNVRVGRVARVVRTHFGHGVLLSAGDGSVSAEFCADGCNNAPALLTSARNGLPARKGPGDFAGMVSPIGGKTIALVSWTTLGPGGPDFAVH